MLLFVTMYLPNFKLEPVIVYATFLDAVDLIWRYALCVVHALCMLLYPGWIMPHNGCTSAHPAVWTAAIFTIFPVTLARLLIVGSYEIKSVLMSLMYSKRFVSRCESVHSTVLGRRPRKQRLCQPFGVFWIDGYA